MEETGKHYDQSGVSERSVLCLYAGQTGGGRRVELGRPMGDKALLVLQEFMSA